MPDGYLQSLQVGKNMIADPNLATYYDKLRLITRGGLFDRQRLVEIWKMNTGQYDALIDRDAYRYPGMIKKVAAEVDSPSPAPTNCQSTAAVVMEDSGVEISLVQPSLAGQLEINLDHNDRYRVVYYLGSQELAQQIIPTAYLPDPGGISSRTVTVPEKAQTAGFNRVRVFPFAGEEPYCLGSFSLH